MKINLYLLNFALNSIMRQKTKSIFITLIFTLLVFLLSSFSLITNAIKYELNLTVDSLPQIIIQNQKGGKIYDIDTSVIDDIILIAGVQSAISRVWGYYYFNTAQVSFTIVGIEIYEEQYTKSLENIATKYNFDDMDINNHDNTTASMIVGSGVKKILSQKYYKDYFNFIKPDGTIKKVYIKGIFKSDTNLESNDMIVMSKDTLREIFDIDEDKASDIVIKIKNKNEIDTIVYKIKELYPMLRIITNEDIKISYENIFNYKGGIFLALFTISLFTFFMIIYDKSSSLNEQERKEIGVLKAIGWGIDDILKEKFYEGFILSFISYVLGVIFAFFYVYILQAPLLKNIFIGYSSLKPDFVLPFIFDIQTLVLVFLLSVPIYISATIIPSWRVSIKDTDEAIR